MTLLFLPNLYTKMTRSWRNLLLYRPCQVTWRVVGNLYEVVDQADGALHTMEVLQIYQAKLLRDLDQGKGLSHEAVTELHWSTDLTLRAT